MPRKTSDTSGEKGLTMQEFRTALRRNSLKATPQRIAVHESMRRLVHATADMVSTDISAHGGKSVSSSAVYSILATLALIGVYAFRMSQDGKMHFDVCSDPHVHLYDTENSEFMDIKDYGLAAEVGAKLSKRRFRGYTVDGVDIEILCHPTRKTRR